MFESLKKRRKGVYGPVPSQVRVVAVHGFIPKKPEKPSPRDDPEARS